MRPALKLQTVGLGAGWGGREAPSSAMDKSLTLAAHQGLKHPSLAQSFPGYLLWKHRAHG